MTDISKDDERAAREEVLHWLRPDNWGVIDGKIAAKALRLLDRPVLPRIGDIPASVIDEMWMAAGENGNGKWGMICALHVLHAHLTASPQPKKVGAWAVKWPDGTHTAYTAQADAIRAATEGSRIVRLVEAADDQ